MTPVHEILNRIRWDAEFARGDFQIGYFDRVDCRIIVVSFAEVTFSQEDPSAFCLVDEDGHTHRIPFHRVRDIYKNGQRIWHRKTKELDGAPA